MAGSQKGQGGRPRVLFRRPRPRLDAKVPKETILFLSWVKRASYSRRNAIA